jgi:hypothetical protein
MRPLMIGPNQPAGRAWRWEERAFVLGAAFATVYSARSFYHGMMLQTGGEWSAPLDDVFIHFDYARATALGHPFEWVPGNGFSSGNTSLSYPFVLALGWLLGFQGPQLMVWAALLAMGSVFGTLLTLRRAFLRLEDSPLFRGVTWLLPPLFLGVGALAWSLWSGMEVAWFLAVWSLALVALFRVQDARVPRARASAEWGLGAVGVLLVLTRPEAAVTLAIFGIAAASRARAFSLATALTTLLRVGLPGVLALVGQACANRGFTGEWSANGAIVKLAMNDPFQTSQQKWDDYTGNFVYAALRIVEYHLSDDLRFGALIPGLALVPFAHPKTRRMALFLTAQIVGWYLVVAANGQVRWQNERYVMPAVAWLMVLATLGVAVLLHGTKSRKSILIPVGIATIALFGVATRKPMTNPHESLLWGTVLLVGTGLGIALTVDPLRRAAAVGALLFFSAHQANVYRGQKWFFGRACRNIRDQQTTLGRFLKTEVQEHPDRYGLGRGKHRVLVGDAGAILYASEWDGLDIIGLGGYHDLPFARAGANKLPATIELLERMPREELPDVLAIFPSWWSWLPHWFSSGVLKRFPIEGNVVCGDFEHVLYRADWHLLGSGEFLESFPHGRTRIVDTLDFADIVNEKAHGYRFPSPHGGFTHLAILPHHAGADEIVDGGRRIRPTMEESFTLRGFTPHEPATLVLRVAPEGPTTIRVLVNGTPLPDEAFDRRTDHFVERPIELPAALVGATLRITLENRTAGPTDYVSYHLWATQ